MHAEPTGSKVACAVGNAVDFQCNICGKSATARYSAFSREGETCPHCRSSVRYRAIIHLLSLAVLGKSHPLPDFPTRTTIRGIGTSDWEGFACRLREKFSYQNTYFDAEPYLDLKSPPSKLASSLDFVICSEVLEHVAPPVQPAFDSIYRILRPGGVLILTVPYQVRHGTTIEHFPDLHKYSLAERDGKTVLVNETASGVRQVFDQLTFHGGRGSTLEFRIFGLRDLMHNLHSAGFIAHVEGEPTPEYGIFHFDPWSLPITAVKPRDW